jgi:hypothetical protein
LSPSPIFNVPAGVDRIDGRLVGAALSIAIFSRSPFAPIALSKKHFAAAMSRFAVNRKSMVFPLLVDSAVEVFPDALDLDLCLIHTPAAADRALVFAGNLLDERQKTDRPSLIYEWSTDTPRSSIISIWTSPFCQGVFV